MEQEEKYSHAKKRVSEIKAFYTHVVTYVAVMILLFIIDMLTGKGLWFYWPLLCWGVAIVIHFVSVFSSFFFNMDKMIEKEMKGIDRK